MLIDFASLELAVPIVDTALLPPRVKFWIELETSMTRALADANGKLPRINKRSEGTMAKAKRFDILRDLAVEKRYPVNTCQTQAPPFPQVQQTTCISQAVIFNK